LIFPGDYYYEDDEDNLIVKATVYHEMLKDKREANFDYTRLNQASSQKEYEDIIKEYEKSLKTHTLLDRKVAGKAGC
jgi:hypothetical protein